jgi:phenylpropionate dioxygenase-like ring-hydroxylating dioxygenase large terminal subunit
MLEHMMGPMRLACQAIVAAFTTGTHIMTNPSPTSTLATAPTNDTATPSARERSFSHPVLLAAELQDAPVRVRLLGEHWVLWRDEQGKACAALDQCPHRGAQLSLGRVCQGKIECPYHGWVFDGEGRCVSIPAVPGFKPPATHGLRTVSLMTAYGLLWLRPDGGEAGIPHWEGEADERLRKVRVGPYVVASSAPRIVENFLDQAHFSYVHRDWLGDADHPQVPHYEVSVDAAQGVRISGCKAWQPRSNRLSTTGSWVDYDYAVPAPCTATLAKAPEQQGGYRESIALFICPEDEEQCRVWFGMAVPDFDSTDEQIQAFQHTIFTQDQPVLESQRPRKLPLGGREVHCAADRSAMAYRRYLQLTAWGFGVISVS